MYLVDYFEKKPRSFIWVIGLLLNLIIGLIDYLTGYEIGMGVFYLMPISLLSWLINRKAGIIMSVISTVTIISTDILAGKVIQNYFIDSWNLFIHFSFFTIVVYLIYQEKMSSDKNETLILKLQKALDGIKTLSGLLSICPSCKKIRDDNGHWKQIDLSISDNTNAEFSHSICPECEDKLYPRLAKKKWARL
jgi:glycosyltransferase involved in cell wall biosynthesis